MSQAPDTSHGASEEQDDFDTDGDAFCADRVARSMRGLAALTESRDLRGMPGVVAGVAFAFLAEGPMLSNGRSAPRVRKVVALARMSDGHPVGHVSRPPVDVDFDKAANDLIHGPFDHGEGRHLDGFMAAVADAQSMADDDAGAMAHDAVERILGPILITRDGTPGERDYVGTFLALLLEDPGNCSRPLVEDAGTYGTGRVQEAADRCDPREREALVAFARDRIASAMSLASDFLATLDPEAMVLARRPDLAQMFGSMSATNAEMVWASLDRTFETGAPLGEALRARPGLAKAIVAHWASNPARFDAMALDDAMAEAAVERGGVAKRNLPLLASCLACGAWDDPLVPRRLLRVDGWTGDVATALVRCASPYPPNWHPSDAEGWHAFATCAPGAAWATRMHPVAPSEALGGAGRWPELATRLRALAGDQGLEAALDGTFDMADAFSRQVVVPAMTLSGALVPVPDVDDFGDPSPESVRLRDLAHAVLASGRRVARVLEVSKAWHAREGRIAAVMAGLPWSGGRPRGWPPCYPDLRMREVSSLVLTDDAQLADEGRAGTNADGTRGLSHCVGGYASRCRQGRCRILSIRSVARDGSVLRLSTAELVRTSSGVAAAQHLGAGNQAPPDDAVAFLERYLGMVNSGMLDLEPDDLAPVPDAGDPLFEAGYDYAAPGNWEAVRDAWAPLLPRAARTMSAYSLVAAVSAREARDGGPWSPDAFGGPSWR